MTKNILFLTEMGFVGKVPKDYKELKVPLAWVKGLDADNVPLQNLIDIKDKLNFDSYSSIIVIIPKNKPQFLMPIYDRLPLDKVVILQEGPCQYFQDLNPMDINKYKLVLENCKMILCHNESDVSFFKQFNDNCKRIITCTDVLAYGATKHKAKKVLIGATHCSWYNGQTSVAVAKTFQKEGYALYLTKMGRFKKDEDLLCLGEKITPVDYTQWSKFMEELAYYSFAVHLMPTKAAGSFFLNCAMVGVPCICGPNDVAKDLFPWTTVDNPHDYVKAKRMAEKLVKDNKFREKVIKHASENLMTYDMKIVCNRLKEML